MSVLSSSKSKRAFSLPTTANLWGVEPAHLVFPVCKDRVARAATFWAKKAITRIISDTALAWLNIMFASILDCEQYICNALFSWPTAYV